MCVLCRYQSSDSGGGNVPAETEEVAEQETRDCYCHSRTTVGLDQGEASTSAELETAQV